jgi:hypothetical protein
MLSKCANPECSERFLYLHQGKLFCLTPTPEVQAIGEVANPKLSERFWLCERCAKALTLVWGGTRAKLVPLPEKPLAMPAVFAAKVTPKERKRSARSASHGR